MSVKNRKNQCALFGLVFGLSALIFSFGASPAFAYSSSCEWNTDFMDVSCSGTGFHDPQDNLFPRLTAYSDCVDGEGTPVAAPSSSSCSLNQGTYFCLAGGDYHGFEGEYFYGVRGRYTIGENMTFENSCDGDPTISLSHCGSFVIASGVNRVEECDDGNENDGDGCSSVCAVEEGWVCSGEPSSCTEEAVMGDFWQETKETYSWAFSLSVVGVVVLTIYFAFFRK